MDIINRGTSRDQGEGDDQIGIEETDRIITDERFIAEFKRISGPSALVKALKLAALCAAKKSFSTEKLTLQKVKLSASKFSKYARIGEDKRFDEIRDQLPTKAGHSVLYAMSQLNDEQWQRGFDEGIINPRSSRSDIDAFRTGVSRTKAARIQSVPFFAAVTIPQKVRDQDKEQFRAAFISLCEEAGFEAVFPDNPRSRENDK